MHPVQIYHASTGLWLLFAVGALLFVASAAYVGQTSRQWEFLAVACASSLFTFAVDWNLELAIDDDTIRYRSLFRGSLVIPRSTIREIRVLQGWIGKEDLALWRRVRIITGSEASTVTIPVKAFPPAAVRYLLREYAPNVR